MTSVIGKQHLLRHLTPGWDEAELGDGPADPWWESQLSVPVTDSICTHLSDSSHVHMFLRSALPSQPRRSGMHGFPPFRWELTRDLEIQLHPRGKTQVSQF